MSCSIRLDLRFSMSGVLGQLEPILNELPAGPLQLRCPATILAAHGTTTSHITITSIICPLLPLRDSFLVELTSHARFCEVYVYD